MKEFEQKWDQFNTAIVQHFGFPEDMVHKIRQVFYSGAIAMRHLQYVDDTEQMAEWTKRQMDIDAELDSFTDEIKLRLERLREK
jgi:L-rhamnose mutarotase